MNLKIIDSNLCGFFYLSVDFFYLSVDFFYLSVGFFLFVRRLNHLSLLTAFCIEYFTL